jgi:hypothetical protein
MSLQAKMCRCVFDGKGKENDGKVMEKWMDTYGKNMENMEKLMKEQSCGHF